MAPETIYLKDNSPKTFQALKLDKLPDALAALAGKKLSELQEQSQDNLFVFGGSSADQVEDKELFHLTQNGIQTSNLMGFIGTPQGDMVITSRFCPDTAGSNSPQYDFFLYYVLSKVLHFNWLKSFSFRSGAAPWLQLLPLLFPDYLNRACAQGLYKQYMSIQHNDACVKGHIDVARHIKYNIPFQGKICYTQRQYSFDNPLTQLVRHTIEYIRTTPWGNTPLSNTPQTQQNVRLITQATPSYSPAKRAQVIRQNLRPIKTPYFSNYIPLQKLCLRILRQEPISYGTNEPQIYGLVFDGAWLWENYLNTLLKPKGFTHLDNIQGQLSHSLSRNDNFKRDTEKEYSLFTDGSFKRYVDFYKKENGKHVMVLDAKYKNLLIKNHKNKNHTDSMRDDLHQLITYMHIFDAPRGVLACPTKEEQTSTKELLGTLQGLGGKIWIARLAIPGINRQTDYEQFKKKMETNEQTFCSYIQENLNERSVFNKSLHP